VGIAGLFNHWCRVIFYFRRNLKKLFCLRWRKTLAKNTLPCFCEVIFSPPKPSRFSFAFGNRRLLRSQQHKKRVLTVSKRKRHSEFISWFKNACESLFEIPLLRCDEEPVSWIFLYHLDTIFYE